MKCKFCKMEWSGPEEALRAMKECPFCHKPLGPVVKAPGEMSFREVLALIVQTGGTDILKNSNLLLSYFSDYAPTMMREKRLLRSFTECRGNETLLVAYQGDKSQISLSEEQVVIKLTREFSLAEAAAREVCGAFLFALGETGESSGTDKGGKVQKQPAAVPAPEPEKKPGLAVRQAAEPQKPEPDNPKLVKLIRAMRLGSHVDFPVSCKGDKDFQALLANAQKKYIRRTLDGDETALLLFDSSIGGTAAEGFVFTTKRFFLKVFTEQREIPLEKLLCFYEEKGSFGIRYFGGDGKLGSQTIAKAKADIDARLFCSKLNLLLRKLTGEQYGKNLERAIQALKG